MRTPTRFEQLATELGYSLPEALAIRFRKFCAELGEKPEEAFDLLDLVYFRSTALRLRRTENGRQVEERIATEFRTRCELDFTRADNANRTCDLTLTSEDAIEDQAGTKMILDHRHECVMLDRIRRHGTFLWNHNTEKPLGRLENVRIVGRKVAARARFALHDDFATMVWENVRAGIYTGTSAHFRIHRIEYVGREEHVSTYRATLWELVEGSIVPCPADASVGVAV